MPVHDRFRRRLNKASNFYQDAGRVADELAPPAKVRDPRAHGANPAEPTPPARGLRSVRPQ